MSDNRLHFEAIVGNGVAFAEFVLDGVESPYVRLAVRIGRNHIVVETFLATSPRKDPEGLIHFLRRPRTERAIRKLMLDGDDYRFTARLLLDLSDKVEKHLDSFIRERKGIPPREAPAPAS